jgi:hypothetical protein
VSGGHFRLALRVSVVNHAADEARDLRIAGQRAVADEIIVSPLAHYETIGLDRRGSIRQT